MSAGWKKNAQSGNSWFSLSRMRVHVGPGRAVLSGLSETRISPSAAPIVAESLKARLTPLLGRPMLSRIVVDSAGGITARMASLDLVEDPLGLLDPGAGGRPDVEPELAGVDQGEEIAAEKGHEQGGDEHESGHASGDRRARGPGTSRAQRV